MLALAKIAMEASSSVVWSKETIAKTLASLHELDWRWLHAPLETQAGIIGDADRNCVLEELFRFIVVKVATGDLDEANHFSAIGIIDTAFQSLLLHPFFCAQVMRSLKHPGRVLSHIPSDRDEKGTEERVRHYIRHHRLFFGSDPPHELPSSKCLWPAHLLQARGQKRKHSATPLMSRSPSKSHPDFAHPLPQEVDASSIDKRQEPAGGSSQHVHVEPERPCGSSSGEILVKTLSGKTLACSFPDLHSAKVADLVRMLHDSHGVPANQVKLIWSGREIHSPRLSKEEHGRMSLATLGSLGMENESILHLVLTVRGHCSCVPPTGV